MAKVVVMDEWILQLAPFNLINVYEKICQNFL